MVENCVNCVDILNGQAAKYFTIIVFKNILMCIAKFCSYFYNGALLVCLSILGVMKTVN